MFKDIACESMFFKAKLPETNWKMAFQSCIIRCILHFFAVIYVSRHCLWVLGRTRWSGFNICLKPMFWAKTKGKNEKMAFQSGMIRCILHINCIIAMNQKYVQWPENCITAPRSWTTLSLWNIRDAHATAYLSLAADQRSMKNIVYMNVFSTFYRKT